MHVVEQCLVKDPSARPANAGELLLKVQHLARGLPRGLSGTDLPLPTLRPSNEYTAVDANGSREPPSELPSSEQPTAGGVPRRAATPKKGRSRLSILDTIRESLMPTRQGTKNDE